MDVFSSNRFRSAMILLPLTLFACTCVSAQQNLPPAAQPDQSGNATDALQKATQNPVANLTSVPLQDNTNLGIGRNKVSACPIFETFTEQSLLSKELLGNQFAADSHSNIGLVGEGLSAA